LDLSVMDAATGRDRLGLALVAVGIGSLLLQLFLVGWHFGLSHDESVYLSQVDPHVPNFAWHAWRAWGLAVLMAPVAVFSPGIAAIRVYVSVLTAVGLVLAFWPWLRVLRSPAVPLAALLFATGWVSVYFGNDVQPNFYVALGAVATVGLFLRVSSLGSTRPALRLFVALGVAVFIVALVRPSDSVLLVGPLVVLALLRRAPRWPSTVAPLVAGVILGWVPWVIEAYLRFGGPVHRLHLSNAQDAVGGLHLNVRTASFYLRMLDGPFYGYRDARSGPLGGYPALWLVVVGIGLALAAYGVVVALRVHQLFPVAAPVLVAASFATFYVFLLTYGAPRFLLPIFALLSIPVATGLVALARTSTRLVAASAATLAVTALVASNVGVQLASARQHVVHDEGFRTEFLRAGDDIRRLDLRHPCLLLGALDPQPTAYYARCQGGVPDLGAVLISQAMSGRARGMTVVVIGPSTGLPAYFGDWTATPLTNIADGRLSAWLPPEASRVSG
jgi:hypothetical protein